MDLFYIHVETEQIVESFYDYGYTNQGAMRIERFYHYFGYVEGCPMIEEIADGQYRLITCKENIDFYREHTIEEPILCMLKTFSNDSERYLEVLKHLIDGKANSSFNDKYQIVDKLLLNHYTLSAISKYIQIPVSELLKFNYREDKYQPYLELARRRRVRTCMEDTVKFLKRRYYFKGKSELYLLQLVLGKGELPRPITYQTWLIAKEILEEISEMFDQLHWENQCRMIFEICSKGRNDLIPFHKKEAQELLESQNRRRNRMPMITIQSRGQQKNARPPHIYT
ncbi:hypothetical protein [Halobacillus naozhouensis]|uniref:Uncharacterized protein n=1 Tax=Halobacillus naozhouensis TaxID=554880 RepID=A0ABY8IXJ6_9BACI|nr:hypothetical protein [Halobacillus naozhouensis]WFT73899.1 hypothetical protein P9989_16210 [Halobacillus naozhouensis]